MNEILYLALGDSIATGTLHSFARVNSYTEHLYHMLQRQNRRTRMVNLARDGDTTGDLLYKLGQGRFQYWVRRADLITLSIGGNNLMRAASIPGFTNICIPKANAGLRAFRSDWEKIIRRLRALNPRCILLVMTVYNPYNRTRYLGGSGMDRGLRELTEQYLDQMNGLIETSSRGRYLIADIHGLFDRFSRGNMGRVTCLYTPGPYILRNPHPTPFGHLLISRAHMDRIRPSMT